MENKPATETQEQNTQTSTGPVTATQPVGESPDVVARQHKLAQDYAQVTGKQEPPAYLLNGHEVEFQSEIDEAERIAILANTPYLDKWREENPLAAAIADDDLANLAKWSKLGEHISNTNISRPHNLNTISSDAVYASANGARHSEDSTEPASANDGVLGADKSVGTETSAPSEKEKLIQRIEHADEISESELEKLIYDIRAQSAINPGIAQTLVYGIRNGDTSREDVRGQLGPPRLSEGTAKLIELMPKVAAIVVDDATRVVKYIDGNIDEAFKGIVSSSISSPGYVMEFGSNAVRRNTLKIDAAAQKIAYAESLSDEDLRALKTEIWIDRTIAPRIALPILQKVLDKKIQPEEALRELSKYKSQLNDTFSEFLLNTGIFIQEYGENLLPAEPGMENSPGRIIGEAIGPLIIAAIIALRSPEGGIAYTMAESGGRSASAARKAGQSKEIQQLAAWGGFAAGSVNAVPVGKLAGRLLAQYPMLAHPLARLAGRMLEDGAKNGSQQFLQNTVTHFLYDPEKNLSENVRESVFAAMLFRLGFDSVKAGQTLRNTKRNDAISAEKAMEAQPVIDDISNLATTSKLRTRAPEELEKYVAGVTKDGPFKNVYLDVDKLPEVLKGNGISPHDFAEGIGVTRSQLDAIINSGGDMKIPTAIYATRVANLSSSTSLKDSIRFDPSAFSGIQAREYYRRINKKLIDARIQPQKAPETVETEGASRTISSDKPVSTPQNDGTTALADPVSGNSVTRDFDRETRKTVDTERARRVVRDLLDAAKNKPTGTNRKKNVGRAGDSVVQAVKDTTGLDISNTQHSLGTTTIRDALNTKHPDPQRQVVRADIEAVHEIISSADRIISGAKNARGKPIIGYIKHMSDGRTLYLEQTKTGPKTFTIDALTKYPAGTDFDAVSQTVLSDVRAKNGDNVKMTPVTKGDAQPLPLEDGKVRPSHQQKAGGKRASASEGVIFGGSGAGGIAAVAGVGLSDVANQGANNFLAQQQAMAERGEPTAIAAMAQLNDWWGQSATSVADAGVQAADNTDLAAAHGTTILGTVSTDSMTKTAAVDSGMQRQFSRDFLTYMMEGKVPSPELAGTFETARKWLTTAYQTVTALNGKTSPEVAEVFNRMLVSDGQLEMARLDAGESGPIFTSADAMGLSEAAYADFTATRQQSEDEASAEMLQSVMQPVRREQDKAYAQEKATVRAQVEKQVNTEGHYRATELMSNRHWLGDGEMPEHLADIRFDEAMLVAHYGEGILGLLPRGRQTVYTAKGGLDPDDVATIFGYSSGDELLRLMVTQPPRIDSIDIETARIMRERHGDPLYDGTADLKAMDAIHNDRRGQWLAMELKAVGRLSNEAQNTSLKEAHANAVSMMSTMSVADAMESRRFLAAERRAAEEAERLGVQLSTVSTDDEGASVTTQNGDADVDADIATGTSADNNETAKKLYTAKKRQLLNHALYVESRKIAHEVEEMERYVQSVDTPARREHFATASFHDNGRIDYNSAMDDLLGRYELSATQTNDQFGTLAGRQVGATGGLDAFMEQVKAAGRENELAISDAVLSTTTVTPYQKLPLQTLRSVVSSIRNLEHITKRAGKLVDVDQTRDFEQTVSGVLGAFARAPSGTQGQSIANDMAPAAADSGVTGGTGSNGGNGRPRPYLDPAMNANLVLRDLDGSEKAGAVQAAIKAPVDAAAERLLVRKQKAASDLAALYDVYSPVERQDMGRRLHVPALGRSMSKWDMIAIALNTGNAENRRQLTDETIKGTLSEQQVVSVLRHLDARDADFVQSVWDYAGSFKADIAAREKRVTGVTPQWVDATPVMIGGKRLAGGYYPQHNNTDDVPQALVAGQFAKTQTSGLHGRQQEGQTATPLMLDMSVLHSHVNELVHDLELSEVVANTGRLLRDERIQAAFIQTGNGADHVMLQGWLRDAASGDIPGAALLSGTARFAKDNVTAARLASELGFSITQMSGLSEAMSSIGQEQFAVNLQTALRPGMMRRVAALSPYMSSRQSTSEKFSSGSSTLLDGLSSWMSQRLNHQMVEVPVWLAGYHQGLDKYRQDEAKAISHADRSVKRLQSSRDGKPSGMNNTHKREAETLLTALGALMTAKSGTDKNGVPQGAMPVGNNAGEGIALAIDVAALFHADAVLKAVANGRSPAGDTSSSDRQTALSIAETLPYFRDVESRNTGSSNGARKLADIINASGVFDGIDASGLTAALKTTGLSFGLPATQISQVVEARMPQLSGGETSLLPLLASRSA